MGQSRRYPISDHYDGRRFFNPWGVNNDKSLWDVFKWKMTSDAGDWPESPIANTAVPRLIEARGGGSIHATFIGHATVYIQTSGAKGARNVLTDPQFSRRASPVSFAGPSRSRPPALEIEALPAVDTVVVSHNHYDHLDLPSLRALKAKFDPLFIVPLGNARLLEGEGISKVIELDWWQSHGGVTLVPVQHWSARGVADRNEALWGGYVMELPSGEGNRKVFFAGDTGYGPHFKMIHERCGPIDLSLLPIGAYEPRWFMKDQHMNPDDAVRAHLDLGSRQSMAIHFETIRLTDEAYGEPRREFALALTRHSVVSGAFVAPQVGETLVVH